jgi:hypothetical protein
VLAGERQLAQKVILMSVHRWPWIMASRPSPPPVSRVAPSRRAWVARPPARIPRGSSGRPPRVVRRPRLRALILPAPRPGPPARRDDQARRPGRRGAVRCGCSRAGHDELPSALPAAARHPARQVAQLGDLGVDSALRRLPARLLPGIDLARDTPLLAPPPPAVHEEVTTHDAAQDPSRWAPARKCPGRGAQSGYDHR